MFLKYNLVLRALGSNVAMFTKQFEEVNKGNCYTTTLHAISSCILKCSKLTRASKVFRGISGG